MKLVVLSDNHSNYDFETPEGDVLIHCGDFSYQGKPLEIMNFIDWFKQQPHKHKIWVPGNHELSLEDFPYNIEVIEQETGAICIHNKEYMINRIKFFGSAMTPNFRDWAFMHNKKQAQRYWSHAPYRVDVLITHGPPKGILSNNLEGEDCGCPYLRQYVDRTKPKIHCFGHLHESYGHKKISNTDFYNVSVLNRAYKLENQPTIMEI